MKHEAALLLYASVLGRFGSTVVFCHLPGNLSAQEHAPRVANVSHVQRRSCSRHVCHCNRCRAPASVAASLSKLCIHTLESNGEGGEHSVAIRGLITTSLKVLELTSNVLVQVCLAEVSSLVPTMAVVDGIETPTLFSSLAPWGCSGVDWQGIDDFVPVLHMIPELQVGFFRNAHCSCTILRVRPNPARLVPATGTTGRI
mmetsp:Transcript_163557/g.298343  ORF Transcript_163557/g.298343 Transcript_163557/m.298343 type:complete len:200 (+) Transcript_163557:475-1074(+)